LTKTVNDVIQDIPKIIIMHGTPYFPESFPNDIIPENYQQLGYTKDQIGCSSTLIDRFREFSKNNYVVCNSHQAQRQWGVGKTIWHGLDKEDWVDLPKEPRVVTMISPGGLDKYYDRVFLQAIREQLAERNITHCHISVDVCFKNFFDYREFLGRSLIYINQTRQSPMPRSRTEAMFSGCCVLTTPHQDADEFIEDGINGFIIKRDPKYVVDLTETLLYDYKTAIRIGQEGKKTAHEKFDANRYRQEWRSFLEFVIEDYKQKKNPC